MKGILNSKKGWFIAAYVIGILFFVMYIIIAKKDGSTSQEAFFTNSCLFVFMNILTLVASVLNEKKSRKQLIWKTSSIAALTFSLVLIFFAHATIGLVANYVIFFSCGYMHIRISKARDLFSQLKEENKSTLEKMKYAIWIMISVVVLWLLYGNL